jgi:hypothetical protein
VPRCIGIAFFFVGKTLSPAHPQLVKMERDIIMTRLSFLTTEVFLKKKEKKKRKKILPPFLQISTSRNQHNSVIMLTTGSIFQTLELKFDLFDLNV